jgi:hypothetical protein
VNGLGRTDCGSEEEPIPDCPNGLGNLIVGYNEVRFECSPDPCINTRTGSHNVVVGQFHNFSRVGGLVVGLLNEISGDFASVSGGQFNTASGGTAVVSGGCCNTASGSNASVSGGVGTRPAATPLQSVVGSSTRPAAIWPWLAAGGASSSATRS